MKKVLLAICASAFLISGVVDAKGGGSSGGGGHGGGGGHASSAGGKGGFSSSSAASRPSTVAPAPTQRSTTSRPSTVAPAPTQRSTTTTTTTTSRSYSYNSPYVGGGMMYGGWGMGYGYSNGLMTGLILGNMLHPHNTVVYTGSGTYSNNALLYPDGSVVNKQGYLVGNYVNGVFTPVENGPMVAKPVPADANGTPQQVAQPVIIQNPGWSGGDIVAAVFLGMLCLLLFIIFMRIIL